MRGAMVTMDFSQRMGLAPASKVAQSESIDTDLKNGLWNVLTINLFSKFEPYSRYDSNAIHKSNLESLIEHLYADFFKIPTDSIPYYWSDFRKYLREVFFELPWHRIYSLLEFFVEALNDGPSRILTEEFNRILERENSAYRFIGGKVTPITSNEEIEEIEKALAASDGYAAARTHLQTSLGLLTDRTNPDYRNSIKESISAVESLAKKLVDDEKATLGAALKILEDKHNLHASMKSAFMKLYGYTSDAGGIRHALIDGSTAPTKADARFMLICCSAFINFTIDSIEN